MRKSDGRKLSDETREHLKRRAIQLRKEGGKRGHIARMLGVHRNTIRHWFTAYDAKGRSSYRSKRRGRKPGNGRKLKLVQEAEVRRLIKDRMPDQLKLPFALWTRKSIQTLIRKRYRIRLKIRTVGDYLCRWGFTPQRPLKRAYEQQPVRVRRWLREEYPAILRQCKLEKGEIHWGDETGIRNHHSYGRGYSPRGRTPVIGRKAQRFRANMISTVTNQGKVRFMLYEGTLICSVFLRFVRRLIKDCQRKVFLIIDNLRVHYDSRVKKLVQQYRDRIKLFYLPPYSPELNPDEYLNRELKQGVAERSPARKRSELRQQVLSQMRSLQKHPGKVQAIFKNTNIAYAQY